MLPGKQYTPADILDILRRRWPLLVVPFVLCGFTALLVSRSLPNQFQSDTLIQVVPQRVPESYVRPTVTEKIEDRLNSLSQQIMSRTRLEQIIREYDLYPEQRQTAIMEDIVDVMRKNIRVDVAKQADAFTIRFTADDARTAQRVTARLASLFIDENLRDRGVLAEATSSFLETQLVDARKRLEAQEQRLEEFRRAHAGALPSQSASNLQAIQSTQLQLQSAVESLNRDRDRRLMLERLLNDAKSELAALPPVPTGQGDASANMTAAQRLELAKASLAQLETRLKPQHPDIVRLKRTLRDLERQADAEAAAQPVSGGPVQIRAATPDQESKVRRVQEMQAEMESLDRQIAFKEGETERLRGRVGDYQRRLEAVPGLESQWVVLTRDYDTLQKSYQQLLAKSEESKMAANLERRQIGEQFRVLDPATLPERPVNPKRLQVNLAGAGAGFLIGLALIGLLEYRDTSFKAADDVVTTLALPVLAVVPLLQTRAERARARRRKLLVSGIGGGLFIVVAGVVFWTLRLWRYMV